MEAPERLGEEMTKKRTPNPGSDAAVKKGCTCAVWDNCRGKGRGGNGKKWGWWVTADCPLHGSKTQEEKK